MRPQYFKHRNLFDFNRDTNDVGFPLPWEKGNEDNLFFNHCRKIQGPFAGIGREQGTANIEQSEVKQLLKRNS